VEVIGGVLVIVMELADQNLLRSSPGLP